jgi:outer membrane protein OmpA-like peptidoglycan-associated protein
MAENEKPKDWASDVKKYAPGADEAAIAGIVKHCGIALRSRDASLVSFGDKAETDRVRESFCKKKLGLSDPDEVLDAAIAEVGERMSDTSFRNRVTVYYLLAERYGKLALFGGGAAVAAAAPVAPLAAAAAMPTPASGHAHSAAARDDGDFFGFAALVFGGGATIMIVAAIAAMYISSRSADAVSGGDAMAAATPAMEAAAAEPEIPEGEGVIFEIIDGKPKESVYFAVGQATLAPDFPEVSAPFKEWVEANPGDRIIISGFTDPTGDPAANAALAKARAEAVAAGLVNLGIPADRIDLVKPDDASDESVAMAEARRVEITVASGDDG